MVAHHQGCEYQGRVSYESASGQEHRKNSADAESDQINTVLRAQRSATTGSLV
jgi:hypothetical protein